MYEVRRRSLSGSAVVVATLALVGTVLVPSPAIAAPGDDILVFSNSSVVDTGIGVDGGEYEWISAAITAAGFDVVSFDGGDGSVGAWETALIDIEVFVLPEQETGNFYDPLSPPAWLSEAAKDALVGWIQAGGVMLQSSACYVDEIAVLNEATGVDYSDVLECDPANIISPRWVDDASLPPSLESLSHTSGFDLTAMTGAQLAPLTVWYAGLYSDDCAGASAEYLVAGEFSAGSGRLAFVGWDYYNDPDDQTSWNGVLASLIDGNAAASTWVPAVLPEPVVKEPVTATTAAGESLFTVSPFSSCDDEHVLFRVDPTSALAAPVGDAEIVGFASQGAWDPLTNTAYFPFYDENAEEYVLMTVDPSNGEFDEIGAFDIADLDNIDEISSLAIGLDGSAFLMAQLQIGGTFYELGLFSLNLSDASLTFIAEIDENLLDEPNGFAADPTTGIYYAFEEDSHEFYAIDVATGALTLLGELDSASIDGSSDVTALQIGSDGTFWTVFDDADGASDSDAGMLVTFTLADIAAEVISATEVGIITDGPIPSRSLLLVPGAPELAATGPVNRGLFEGSVVLLLLGGVLIGIRVLRGRSRAA